ncbi:hypothetical protein G6F37_007577 [Rhizopus arrhizus]|nr:hypothetical protein G6F38_007215 [Rhizopus arrhizus]KAG1156468.1 hypothetical protein G6F37_007577 [Rhizopus arrhizus]
MMETNSEEVEEDNLDHTNHHEVLFLTRAPKATGGTRPNNKAVNRTPILQTNNNQQLIILQYPIRRDTSRRTSRLIYQQLEKDNESPLAVIRNTRRLSDSITQETTSMEIEENSPQYLGTASRVPWLQLQYAKNEYLDSYEENQQTDIKKQTSDSTSSQKLQMICWYNGQNDFNDSGFRRSPVAHTISAEGSSSYTQVKLPESGLDFPTVSNRKTRIRLVAYVDSR